MGITDLSELVHAERFMVSRIPMKDLIPPPGFEEIDTTKTKKKNLGVTDTKKKDSTLSELKVKKAWEIATSPAKSIPMNLIMSYMTGNSLQIIPITMTLMLFWNPLKAIFTDTNAAFRDLKTEDNGPDILLTKILFVTCQLLNMGVGIWKLYNMGLIPNKEADWLAWKEIAHFKEYISIL